MKTTNLFLALLATVLMQFVPFTALAADSAVGTLNVSGNVPVIFSLTTRGIPGDLDLTPNVSVANRVLGLLHLKYNVDIASLSIKSSTANGVPANGGTDYDFGAGGFKVAIAAGCASVDAAYNVPFLLTAAGTDIKEGTALTAGIEEDCTVTASWDGTATSLPLSGKYSMTSTVTMTSI